MAIRRSSAGGGSRKVKAVKKRPDPLEIRAERAAEFLKSIANKHRLMVLCVLLEGELSAGQLAERLETKQPNTSQHLFKLKAEGLVATRRDAQTIYYRLASDDVKPIIEHLKRMFCGS
jgi:ArsR family transcriptional regulator, virulence genes transcriptional regulator